MSQYVDGVLTECREYEDHWDYSRIPVADHVVLNNTGDDWQATMIARNIIAEAIAWKAVWAP